MPPVRSGTKPSQSTDSPTTKPEHKKRRSHAKLKEGAPLGVSKIKSALRQTRRLLARDLGADVRIEAERKLKALETDLATAEGAKKERALATRYHKVKFFDRQKLMRRIKQTKRRLEDEEVSSKVRRALDAELFDLRVDLNYVVNYPKLERYISLFPPDVRSTDGAAAPVHPGASSSATDEKRQKLRNWVREQMRAGEMSNEPETLEHRQSVQKYKGGNWENLIDKNKKGAGEEEAKPRQRADRPDDFFEEDGTGSEELEGWEPATDTQPVGVSSKRRADKPANHASQHSKPADRHRTKVKTKHRKNRESTGVAD